MAGLTTRKVPTVPVDPFTGIPAGPLNPPLPPRPSNWWKSPVQTTKGARGQYRDPMNNVNEPWPGPIDQTFTNKTAFAPPPYNPLNDPNAGVSQAYVDSLGAPGKNQGTGPIIPETPASNAIEVLVRGGNPPPVPGPAFGGGWGAGGFGRQQPMNFEPLAPATAAPQGDPWAGLRVSPQVLGEPTMQGLVTGNRQGTAPPPIPSIPRVRATPETFAKNRAAADAALAIDMAGGSTPRARQGPAPKIPFLQKQGFYKSIPKKK